MNTTALPIPKIILIIGDAVLFAASLAAALFIRYGGSPEPVVVSLYLFAAPVLIALWLGGFLIFGLYDLKTAKSGPHFFERLARAIAFNFVVTVLLFYLIPEFGLRPLATLLVIFAALAVFIFGWRILYNALLARRIKERVLFFGITDEVIALERFLALNPQLGFAPAAYLKNGNGEGVITPQAAPSLSVLAFSANLADIVRAHRINLIVIAPHVKRTRAVVRALLALVPLGVAVTDFSRFYEAVEGKIPVSLISETWFLENLIGRSRPRYEFAKRILDLALALVLGAAALLVLPLIAAAVILSTPHDILRYRERRARKGDGIVFFRQQRVGKNGRLFNFIKFRSQLLGAEKLGGEKDLGHDLRSYPMGNLLRKTYLDELPQVWNVLAGEMSFVGPRPERPEFVRELEERIPFYRMRELVLPGITGWAQLNMENDASVSDAPEKMQYDLYYIKNRSLALDIVILLKTSLKLLQRSGR